MTIPQLFTYNGTQLAYHDVGQGLPLLLVHAFPLNSTMWAPQIAALSDRFRVIAPDLRGFGVSQFGTTPASLAIYADDLAALLDHLGIEQVAYCGLSMGGYIGFAFLEQHAARLSHLILADTKAGADTEEARRARETNAQLAEREGTSAVGEAMLPRLVAPNASDTLRGELRTIIAQNSREGVAAALRSMATRPDSTDRLASITLPTLIIVGSEDVLTPPAESQNMHTAIAASQLVEITGVGHLSNLEAPEAFATALAAFLANPSVQQ
jgi:3-oxoadipate enol-lactonase